MKPVTLTHRDGRTRDVTTAAERVAAEFDGFAEAPAKGTSTKSDDKGDGKATGANANKTS